MVTEKSADELAEISYRLYAILEEENLNLLEMMNCLVTLQVSIYVRFLLNIQDRNHREEIKVKIKGFHNKYTDTIFHTIDSV